MNKRTQGIVLSILSVLFVFVCQGSYSYWIEHQPLVKILDDLTIMFENLLTMAIFGALITILVIVIYRPKK